MQWYSDIATQKLGSMLVFTLLGIRYGALGKNVSCFLSRIEEIAAVLALM